MSKSVKTIEKSIISDDNKSVNLVNLYINNTKTSFMHHEKNGDLTFFHDV